MGHIKEPYGVDFFVDPRPLTETDEKIFSEAIAYYKATGKKLTLSKIKDRQHKRVRIKKNTSHNSGKSKA